MLSQETQALAQAQKLSYERILELAQRAFDGGAGTRIDVLDVRARRDLAVAQELEAANTVRNNLRAMQAITKEAPGSLNPIDPGRLKMSASPLPVSKWEELASASSPEIEAARLEVQSAEQEVEKQRAGHFPTVDLVAIKKDASSETESTLNQKLHTSFIGVQVSIPFYAGGYVSASVRQAEARVELARQKLDATRSDVLLRVDKELANVEQAAVRSAALSQAVISVEESAKATAMGVIAGTRTAIEALNAQDQLLRARVELARARFLYVLSFLRLHAAAGVLSEDKLETVNGWLQR